MNDQEEISVMNNQEEPSVPANSDVNPVEMADSNQVDANVLGESTHHDVTPTDQLEPVTSQPTVTYNTQESQNTFENFVDGSEKLSFKSIKNLPTTISDRKLQNLQSANVPGLSENSGYLQPRRHKPNYSKLKEDFEYELDKALDYTGYFPK